MERVTRAFSQVVAARLLRAGSSYLMINAIMLLAEARWHFMYRLTIWDVAEMHRFIVLLGQTIHS